MRNYKKLDLNICLRRTACVASRIVLGELAFLAASTQAVHAALRNPVDLPRYE